MGLLIAYGSMTAVGVICIFIMKKIQPDTWIGYAIYALVVWMVITAVIFVPRLMK